jgi:cytidylate kinase
MFITISREFGAGGSSVAQMVADRLRWRVVDNQVLEEVARRAGLSPDDVARREERGPSFIERLARALSAATPELLTNDQVDPPEADEARLVKVTEQVVTDACEEGPAVLVGRAAVALLSRREDALHVRLVAPVANRIRVIAERFGIGDEEAERRIKATDANRDRYHRQWYHRDWRDPVNYHLTCNTGRLGLERTADLIVALAEPPMAGNRP